MNLPPSDRPACAACHYYQDLHKGAGHCHRYPPCYAGEHSPVEAHRWKHPLVLEHGWCGEFKARS